MPTRPRRMRAGTRSLAHSARRPEGLAPDSRATSARYACPVSPARSSAQLHLVRPPATHDALSQRRRGLRFILLITDATTVIIEFRCVAVNPLDDQVWYGRGIVAVPGHPYYSGRTQKRRLERNHVPIERIGRRIDLSAARGNRLHRLHPAPWQG